MLYAFSRGISGYLHWGYNNWNWPLQNQVAKGDGYIVQYDIPNNKLRATIRLEALRDGIEGAVALCN